MARGQPRFGGATAEEWFRRGTILPHQVCRTSGGRRSLRQSPSGRAVRLVASLALVDRSGAYRRVIDLNGRDGASRSRAGSPLRNWFQIGTGLR